MPKSRQDTWKESWVQIIRDGVHNLDLSIPKHQEIYEVHARTFIMFSEVEWDYDKGDSEQIPTKPKIPLKAYPDMPGPEGKMTIGVGFNMEAETAKQQWREVLGNSLPFDDVLKGRLHITIEQAMALLDYQIKKFRKELKRFFGESWEYLKPNERIAIESMYFNSPILIRRSDGQQVWDTNFAKNIKEYIKTSDVKYLKQAVDEVKYRSNRQRIAGLQKRRDQEALMLKSYRCPLYSKPMDSPIPDNAKMNAKIGVTVIPRVLPDIPCHAPAQNRKYYIWRTKGDDKVRPDHQTYEGKIFDVDNPPPIVSENKNYNCRCEQDFAIPKFVIIQHELNTSLPVEQKMVRKFITSLAAIPNFCIR